MKRILVVDDSPLVRALVVAGVTAVAPRTELVEAENGAAALAHLRRGPFDLVLCDLNMPVLDGHGLLARLRALPEHRRTPVVVLSSLVNEAIAAQLRAAGANLVYRKPFTGTQLREALRLTGLAPR